MNIQPLTSAEESLIHLLWNLDSFYLKDIMEQHPEPKPHQNTVSTYLKILVEKSFLSTEKEGRIFKYSIAVSKDRYADFLLRNIVQDYFKNSKEEFTRFLEEQKLINLSEIPMPPPESGISRERILMEEVLEHSKEKPKKDKKKKGKKKK